jgi:hypothetical protein
MNIGFTGHQQRDGADWDWTKSAIQSKLLSYKDIVGYSSLAAGNDQIFAHEILSVGGQLITVIPMSGYEEFFPDELSKQNYLRLLSESYRIIELTDQNSPETSFYNAGEFIVDASDLLLSVWDGKLSRGFGGTADIVKLARSRGKQVFRIDPVAKITEWVQ